MKAKVCSKLRGEYESEEPCRREFSSTEILFGYSIVSLALISYVAVQSVVPFLYIR